MKKRDRYVQGRSFLGRRSLLREILLRQVSAKTKPFSMVTISISTTRYQHHFQISASMFPSIATAVFAIANFLIQVSAYMS